MTNNSKNTKKSVALIKFFSEESHYLAFKNGVSLFRTPHFYRLREDAGRGDRSESCLGYWNKDLGDKMPNLSIDDCQIHPKSFLIYPAHEQKDSWLQSWCIIDTQDEFYNSLDQMIAEFGNYFVIMKSNNIKKYAALVGKASGSQVRYGFIEYSENPLKRSLTVKDLNFSYQKEFRFYVGECEKDETIDKVLKIHRMNDILSDAKTFKIHDHSSGKTKYYSLGQKDLYISG